MRGLFYNVVKHLPNKPIKREDFYILGYTDNYDVYLVIEEWEFRIYNYEYWSYENIHENHEDEDWRDGVGEYFEGMEDYMDTDTCEYSVAEFENKTPIEMAIELANRCEEDLEDCYNARDWASVSTRLINFITAWLTKIAQYKWQRVYGYYK